MQLDEELLVAQQLITPGVTIESLQLLEALAREIEAVPLDVFVARHPADRRLAPHRPSIGPIDNPLQHPHVLTEAGPHEVSILVLAEPIDVEDARSLAQTPLHANPVAEIVAHVVPAERKHGHRIAAHLADRPRGRGGHLRPDRRPGVDSPAPVEGLVDERNGRGPPPPKDDRTDRHPFRILPVGIDRRALAGRGRKPGIGMGRLCPGLAGNLWRPAISLPVETLRRCLVGHPLPPDATFRGQRNIGKDRVARQRRHRVRIGLHRGSRRHPEESGFRIDGPQPPLLVRLDPGNVVTNRPDLPAFKTGRRDEHRKVGLATGARKGGRHIGLLTLRILQPKNQHVLGHPPLVTGNVRSDPQRKTLFAQQGVATVSGTI